MELKERAKKLLEKIDLEAKKKELSQIQSESQSPNFWQDQSTAASKMKEMAAISHEIQEAETLSRLLEDGKLQEAQKLLEKMEIILFFGGEYDFGPAFVSIHSGQGGVEAMDWAKMLFRMYTRYVERKGWKFEVIEETPGEEAGYKSVSFLVEGDYAYGHLKTEAGVHRLVRLSPFNADSLRQTSFALVEVMPQVEKDDSLDVSEDDLEWDFYRASSHGGQNVQKVSSAVRLKHKPTGLVVTAQSERYQGQNREYALKLLKGKLWLLREEERRKEEEKLKGGYKMPGWGNQIRSYVLHPYKMVKDLRTGYETADPSSVLDGALDHFIEKTLRAG